MAANFAESFQIPDYMSSQTLDYMREKPLVTNEGIAALEAAMQCWNAGAEFRKDRSRNKDYTFGKQWNDVITVDGFTMTEEEYIIKEGNIPLKNNLIRRLVRNVAGVFRNRLAERMEQWTPDDLARATANRMQELYGRTMEEFLISGMAVHRKWRGLRDGKDGVWTDMVSPEAFFFDRMARDPRGNDITMLGQVHELRLSTFCSAFARDESDYIRFHRAYQSGLVKVVELWKKDTRPCRLCHDRANGTILKMDEETWLRHPEFHSMPSKWTMEERWRFYFVTSRGELLRKGDSPMPDGGHPYVFKAYPFLDGEIHSFVADIIDQQRYTNRLITLYDWLMRASAKGVLLFPDEAISEDMDLNYVADQWSRFNGMIVYHHNPGQPLPQQVSNNAANVGIGDLLSIQLKMMEDISGVNGTLQGKIESQSMSGNLYSQQTENSLTSLCDILDTFDTFISDSLAKERLLAGVPLSGMSQ